MSSRYDPSTTTAPREHCLIGGDKTVPEFLRGDEFHDPFKADVYYAGNLIRTEFMQVRRFPSIWNVLLHYTGTSITWRDPGL